MRKVTQGVLSRFIRKVGEENLNEIINEKVIKLLRTNDARNVDAVLDASFIKAWSIRHPTDSQTGYSDADARVGRAGRTFSLGYKLHLSIDAKSMLPLANVFASANQNEKKHSNPGGQDTADSKQCESENQKRYSGQSIQRS